MAGAQYVEVVGEAEYTEAVERVLVDVDFLVESPNHKTALDDLSRYVAKAVEALEAGGLQKDEIHDGGIDLFRLWFVKKGRRTARHRIMLQTADEKRVTAACLALESIPKRKNWSFNIRTRQPVFTAGSEIKQAALRRAMVDAREKAVALAEEGGRRLGKALKIKEEGMAERSSGHLGDEDWAGDSTRFALRRFRAKIAPAEPELQEATRTIWLRCRVRFELL
jgi:hypothetical protein